MAFKPLEDSEIAVGKALVKNIFQKTKDNFDIIHKDLNSVLIKVKKVEIFNSTVLLGNFYSTLTGIAYYQAPSNMSFNACIISIFEKGSINSGNLEIDVKKNSSYNSVGMNSVFSTRPKIAMGSIADYGKSSDAGQTAAVFSTVEIAANDILRLDITSIPAGLSRFNIFLIGN